MWHSRGDYECVFVLTTESLLLKCSRSFDPCLIGLVPPPDCFNNSTSSSIKKERETKEAEEELYVSHSTAPLLIWSGTPTRRLQAFFSLERPPLSLSSSIQSLVPNFPCLWPRSFVHSFFFWGCSILASFPASLSVLLNIEQRELSRPWARMIMVISTGIRI